MYGMVGSSFEEKKLNEYNCTKISREVDEGGQLIINNQCGKTNKQNLNQAHTNCLLGNLISVIIEVVSL